MKESTARIGDGRTDGRTLTTGLEVNAFRAVGRKSITLILRVFSRQLSRKLKFLSPDFLNFKNPIYRENEIFTTYFLHDFGSFFNSLSDGIGGFSYF